MEGEDDGAEALAGGVGGPGAEDWANGAAALSAALAREARVLAQAAAALRAACAAMPGDPSGGGGGPVSDVRRQRAVLHAAGEAALRAALALEAAEALHAAAPEPKRLRILPGVGHNDLIAGAGSTWAEAIAAWAGELPA